jgi:hypothetical protein
MPVLHFKKEINIMLQLKNAFMQISIDELNNANIVSMSTPDGLNILDKKGLCTWLKSGQRQDPSTGVLGNFYKTLFIEPMGLVEKDASHAFFSRTVDGLTITKRITLDNNLLKVEFSVRNGSAKETSQMQVEHFNMFAGGRLPQRDGMFTMLIEGPECSTVRHGGLPVALKCNSPLSKVKAFIECANFGERYVKAFDYKGTSIVAGDTNRKYFLKLSSDHDCETATVMIHGNTVTRGFNSLKFKLHPGETFVHAVNFELHTGEIPEEYIEGRCAKRKTIISKTQALENIASLFEGEPVFKERWSHLCLQYDKTEPDAVKKIIGEMLTPLRYTGVIFEFDRGLQTGSHPELAETWSWSMEEAKNVINFAKRKGLKIGVEFNVPGHQNETGIEKAYPELLECGKLAGRTSTLCVSNIKARQIVKDIYKEYQEEFQPDLIFLAADEVQFEGGDSSFARCPLCNGKEPAKLFGDYLDWLLKLVQSPDTDVIVAGDMFLQSEQFGPLVSGNGSAGNVWKALDGLSKRYTIGDWHYYPTQEYRSLDFFLGKGFEVLPITAFHFEAMRLFLRDAERLGISKVLHTTWAVPNQEKLPIESMVWAALYHWLGKRADELPVRELAVDFCNRFW